MTRATVHGHLVGGPAHGCTMVGLLGADGLPRPVVVMVVDEARTVRRWARFRLRTVVETRSTRHEYAVDIESAHFDDDGGEGHVYRYAGRVKP